MSLLIFGERVKQVKFKLLFFTIINLTFKLNAFEFYEVRIVSTFQPQPSNRIVQVRLNYFFDNYDTASIFIQRLNNELRKKTPADVTPDTAAYKQGLVAIQNRLSLFDRKSIYSTPMVECLFSQPIPKHKPKDLIMTYIEQAKKRSSLEFTK